MNRRERELVDRLIAEYTDWVRGLGGRSIDELRALPLTTSQRETLSRGIEDVHFLLAFTPLALEARELLQIERDD